jgi:hypothetical protein
MLCAVSNGAETVGVSCALSREQWEGNGGNREESNTCNGSRIYLTREIVEVVVGAPVLL